MEELLYKAKKRAEAAEVFLLSSEITPVDFEANRLKRIQSKQTTTVALRIIKEGRIGYAISSGLEDRDKLVEMAIEVARFGTEAKFEFPQKTAYPQVYTFDPETASLPIERMVTLGEELIAQVTTHTPELVCEAEVSKALASVQIINSNGGYASYQLTSFTLGISGTLVRDSDMLFVGDSESSCHTITQTVVLAERVIRQLELAKNPASVASKRLPVLFTPRGFASTMLAPLMSAFNGKLVWQGASPLASRLGEQVFDTKLNLLDDPTLDFCPQSRPFDDEGVPSRKTPLIKEGRVMNFLYDLQTAALAGTKSTGSASRRGGSLPSPAPSAFIIENGDTPFEDMVRDIKEGLVVEEVMGAEQGNILSGVFSGNVLLGYKIESGKIVGRVKDTMISGNTYDILSEIVAIGNDSRWIDGRLMAPSIYCANLSVATKK